MIQHVAFVMDGNRRFAKRHGLMPWYGHREGVDSLRRVIDFCLEKQIPHASFYTFSLENFKRPEQEVRFLFDLIVQEAESKLSMFLEKGARIRFIGDRTKFPESVRAACERLEEATQNLATINLNFLFCYGARQEILGSVKALVKAAQEGKITENDVNEELFSQSLWTYGIPEPELIIRTGGVKRLSNFLLYQAAYSEFYFLDCLWPEITREHLQGAFETFEAQNRNFGL